LDLLVNRHVDGLIFIPQRFSPTGASQNELVRLSRKGHAIVSLGQIVEANSPSLDSIVTDMSIGMRQAIEHLLHLGHRRIAYFGPPAGVAEVRLQLFKSMLAEHRVKADASLIFRVDPTAEQGFRLAECVLERRSKPTAIVAVNDMVAIGAMMALQEHGLTLPDDMSIIGIDDLPFASIVRPTLTTIHQPKNELGRLAAKRLLGRINREFCQYRVISLPTRLIVRDSTAHVPSRNSKQ
jgi:DNA-binding LacI/PurR family transcriptional regulator